jgi:hypothetical protein
MPAKKRKAGSKRRRGRKGSRSGSQSTGRSAGRDSSHAAADFSFASLPSPSFQPPAVRRTRNTYEGSQFQQHDEEITRAEAALQAVADAAQLHRDKIHACEEVSARRITKKSAAGSLQMPVMSFYDMYTRWQVRGTITAIGHNPPLLDEESKAALEQEVERRSLEGAGWRTVADFAQSIEPFWRDTIRRRGDKRWQELPWKPGTSTIRARMAEYIPHRLRAADRQNVKRFNVRVNLLPAISGAAVSRSVLQGKSGGMWPEDPTGIQPAFIFNTDELSTDVQPIFTKKPSRISNSAASVLRRENFGVKSVDGLAASTYTAAYSTLPAIERSAPTSSATLALAAPGSEVDRSTPISAWQRSSRYYGKKMAHRGVSIDFTTSGDYKLICMTATWTDSKIPEEKFHIYPLQSTTPGEVYLILRAIKVDEDKLAIAKLQNILFPATTRHRERIVASQCISMADLATDLAGHSSSGPRRRGTSDSSSESSSESSSDSSSSSDRQHNMSMEGGRWNPPARVGEKNWPRAVLTMDGCGTPLTAIIRCAEEPALFRSMPPKTNIYKHQAQGTALFQQNDACKGHQVFNDLVDKEKDILCEGSEAAMPYYMKAVHDILVGVKLIDGQGFAVDLYRTIFKFMCNFEHWAHCAMSRHNLMQGYMLTGWVPWNCDAFLQRWAGYKNLELHDLHRIGAAFPQLVAVAQVHGMLHKEFVTKIMGEFINEAHQKGVSRIALQAIALEECKKPISLRNINEWGPCQIDNTGLLARRREAVERREEDNLQESKRKYARTVLMAIKMATGVLLYPKRVLDSVVNVDADVREAIYTKYKCLGEEDFLQLRLVSKDYFAAFKATVRYAPIYSKALSLKKSRATKARRTEEARLLLEDL